MNLHSTSQNKQIIILDPGLREHGGHHPAFILSMLKCEVLKSNTTNLIVYANKAFVTSELFSDINTVKKNELIPFFDIDYYQHFYGPTTHPELRSFIQKLTLQYLAAFTHCAANKPKQKKANQVYFFHTIGWEHANALADALYLFEKQTGAHIRVVVLLMFSPYRHCDTNTYDHKVYLKYTIAFKRLAAFTNISFFACDHETSKAYEHILARKIEICPLPFISNKYDSMQHEQQTHPRQVILYLGDTKATKGFIALPKIAQQILSADKHDECAYIVQYTLTNTSSEFVEADKQLKKLAKQHKNIDIYDEFWSEEKLHQMLSNSYGMIFNYDSQVYQFQSSGVLWLAAHNQLKMIFLSDNWLAREAERLNCDYTLRTLENSLLFTNNCEEGDIMKNSFNVTITNRNIRAYGAIMFGDFNNWLKSNVTN